MTYVKSGPTPYSSQKNWSNDYLTDPALVKALGPFSYDPACPEKMPWSTARTMMHKGPLIDGLKADWRGRVWLNPPYRGVLKWARKMVEHGNGIVLLNGRSTETRATQLCMANSTAVFFTHGRLSFYKVDGSSFTQRWFPSLLVGFTDVDADKLRRLPKRGFPGVYLEGPNHV